MSSPIQIACPHCSTYLRIAGATAGKQVRCPQCQGILQVPEAGPPPNTGPSHWKVRGADGTVYGPVTREELEQWMQEGRLHAESQISPQDAQQWIWASELFPQLAGAEPWATATPFMAAASSPSQPPSEKSRLVAGLLGLLLPLVGLYGIHRLYTGHIGLGVLMLITCGGCGIWQLIDVILVFAGSVTDVDGRPLRD